MSTSILQARLSGLLHDRWTVAITRLLLLAVAISLLWLIPLGRSFWVDETVTVFVVDHGAHAPSLAIAPQVSKSIYYPVARVAAAMFGVSEAAYRLPSILAAALALFLIGRIAARLIDPQAAWFAVFACLTLSGFNSEARDARPYALGFCVAAASFLFLVRWLGSPSGKWLNAAGFVVSAALLWRVHLLLWPVYLVFAMYAVARLVRKETAVTWPAAALVFACLGIALVPVMADAIAINREAREHVIVSLPTFRDLLNSMKLSLPLACAAGAWLATRFLRVRPDPAPIPWASLCLALGWWLIPPICLFAFSRMSGNSVFVQRYLSIGLPGAALAATFLAALILPRAYWKQASVLMGFSVLLTLPHGMHRSVSDWRGAARDIAQLALPPDTPVILPSPFIEAKSPEWRPDYPLPGFLYAHLAVYPVPGKAYLFPFKSTPEVEEYASQLCADVLSSGGHFVIYGGDANVRFWQDWFAPRLAGWTHRRLGDHGDVYAVLFENRAATLLRAFR